VVSHGPRTLEEVVVAFVPLSVRRGVQKPFEFVGGVPDHIKVQLVEWIEPFLYQQRFPTGPLTANLDALIAHLQWPIVQRDEDRRFEALMQYMTSDDDRFLDAIDLVCAAATPESLSELDGILDQGMSLYRVRFTDPPGLDERVTEEARAAVFAAASGKDAASQHIADAWAKAYGRDRNATASWNSAVKAIEHLLHPIVEPRNVKATLGSMAAALRARPEGWRFAISARDGDSSARPFLQALELIGYEPGRHGTDPARATIEEARVVVLQAVTIVEWLRSGALERVGR